MSPLYRQTFSAEALRAAHLHRLREPQKQLVWSQCAPPGQPWEGLLEVTRWAAAPLPVRVPEAVPVCVSVPAFFHYRTDPVRAWHVNFADPELFVAWGSPLLAQDELQCLEHPVLGLVREGLLAAGRSTRTEDRATGAPTPILVRGAQRRCALDTLPSLTAPMGLYGHRFARASPEQVRAALTVIAPPTTTHLICMAALACGQGAYTAAQLRQTLTIATTAFSAAAAETPGPAEVHTGFWGCGAFGGDRVVMVALQVLAARLAGLSQLTVYTGDRASLADVADGLAALEQALAPSVEDTLAGLLALGRRWGVSDGN